MEDLRLTESEYKMIHQFCMKHNEWMIEDLADYICEEIFVGYGMCMTLAQIAFKMPNESEYIKHMMNWQLDKVHVYY